MAFLPAFYLVFGDLLNTSRQFRSKAVSVPVLVAYIVSMLVLVLGANFVFDQLIQHEYRNYRNEWEKDGRPWSGLRRPPGAEKVNGAAWKRCSVTWLWSTPGWVGADRTAKRLLWLYRGLGLTFTVGICAVVLYRVSHV